MPSRRAILAVVAGSTLSLAGCADSAEGTERGFGLTTTGTEGVPGQAVGVEVTASDVGVLTYRIDALPPNWQVTQGDFDPGPTAVRETYPPELVWDPPIGSVSGTFIVDIPARAAPGEYSLPIDARSGSSDETAVSTAVVTVEGPTERPSPQKPTASPSPERTD